MLPKNLGSLCTDAEHNTETEILEDKRDGFIPLPGRREDMAG